MQTRKDERKAASVAWVGSRFSGSPLVRCGVALAAAPPPAQNTSLNTCQTTAAKEVAAYSAAVQTTMAKCLNAIAGDKIKKAVPISAATAKTCVKALGTFRNSVDDTKQLDSKATAKISKACDPTFTPTNPKVTHAYDDLVDADASGGQTVTGDAIHAENLGTSCAVGVLAPQGYGGWNTGAAGRLNNIDGWIFCMLMSAEREALRQVHIQYPHGHAWLQEVRPMIDDLAVSSIQAQDAQAILPSYLRWVDKGGQVYDRVTGLTWRKTTTDGSILDYTKTFTWSTASPWGPTGTVFTSYLNGLNYGATGVGGCTSTDGVNQTPQSCDWRLPTVEELQTILLEPYPCSTDPCIDQTVFGPTQSAYYWSASTLAPTPSDAWSVFFGDGSVNVPSKTSEKSVRAVRGGS